MMTEKKKMNSVGRPKHTRVMAGAVEGDYFVGKKATDLKGLLKLHYPIEHGIVTDWDDMEKIWQHLYTEELKTIPEEVNQRFFKFFFLPKLVKT